MKRRKGSCQPAAPSILPVGDSKKRLQKKARRGFRGHPVGTLAFYGPDDRRASKAVAAIIEEEGGEPAQMQKWFDERDDLRHKATVVDEVAFFFQRFGVVSVAMTDRIIGCPHEEGIDYEGPTCPECPFWAGRNRWTGDVVN